MLQQIDWQEFEDWIAYSQLEPWDETREDYRNANVVSAVVNMQRNTKKHPKPAPLTTFLLPFDEETRERQKPRQLTPAETLAVLLSSLDGCGVK